MNAILMTAALFLGGDSKADAPKAQPPADEIKLVGNVTPLAGVLTKQKIKLDADAKQGLALVTADGKIYPLVKNEGSRLFYLDDRLLDRPMQLTGRFVPGSQMLLVRETHSIKEGVLCEVYYWCEKCQLRFPHAGPCICCGMETELWEVPVKK